MRPERQVGQAGAELIGAEGPAADVEVIAVAGEALQRVGVPHLSVDITCRPWCRRSPRRTALPASGRRRLRAALDHKDAAAVAQPARRGGRIAGAAGRRRPAPAAPPAPRSTGSTCRGAHGEERDRLGAVLDGLDGGDPGAQGHGRPGREPRLRIPHRHQLHLFRAGRSRARAARRTRPRRALSGRRSGRARAGDRVHALYRHDPAHPARRRRRRRRVLVPPAPSPARARALRAEGWITVAALLPAADWRERRAASAAAMCSTAAQAGSGAQARRGEQTWPMSPSSAPNGATKARARSSTGCRSAPMSSCASRAATMPATRWSSAMSSTS